MAVEAQIVKDPITGEEKNTIQWSDELNITDDTFRLRMKESMQKHGKLVASVFTKSKPQKLNGHTTSRTRALKSQGLRTVKVNIDTRRKYKRLGYLERKDLFKPNPAPKVDLVALGLAERPTRGQYVTK
jgi:hypothetical protein